MASERSRRFRPALRVKKRREFLRTQRQGSKHQLRWFTAFVRPRRGDEGPARLGITVTRKVCGAVGRNAIKRRVREAFRHRARRFPAGLDVVFVAKRNAAGVSFAQVEADVEQLATRLARGRLDAPRRASDARPETSSEVTTSGDPAPGDTGAGRRGGET